MTSVPIKTEQLQFQYNSNSPMKMKNIPHAIVVPYPAQGHVIPMLELSQRLVKQGIKVTFVNTDFNHKRVESSLPPSVSEEAVTMVSIPDGLEPWEDRNDLGKLTNSIWKVMPAELEALINGSGEPKVVCVIADWTMFWAFDVAERLGLRRAVFCSAAAATLALTFSLPKLVSDGIIDENEFPNMDFLSNLTKGVSGGGDESKKPAGVEKSSSGDLLANAKVVAEAAKAQFGNEPAKYDKSKAAGAAAELIDAAEKYAKLDETQGVGKYAEQAEDYLRSYSGKTHAVPAASHTTGEDKPAPAAASHAPPAAEKGESEGGYGDLMKAAGGFFKK